MGGLTTKKQEFNGQEISNNKSVWEIYGHVTVAPCLFLKATKLCEINGRVT